MSSCNSSTDVHNEARAFDCPMVSPEITCLGTSFRHPREFCFRARHPHLDPRLRTPESQVRKPLTPSPQALRAHRGNASASNNPSPRSQREIQRLAQYQLSVKSKQELRHIIHVIQSKYLQRDGEKEAAANLIQVGGLGWEFPDFDEDSKWQWLQIRVDTLRRGHH
ncbi:hypothetical protein DFH28DRAFT_1121654 [Melampsora americana]|nr:hypothetical protein DFH28DRAFT_1121654 [Melampsora americana]